MKRCTIIYLSRYNGDCDKLFTRIVAVCSPPYVGILGRTSRLINVISEDRVDRCATVIIACDGDEGRIDPRGGDYRFTDDVMTTYSGNKVLEHRTDTSEPLLPIFENNYSVALASDLQDDPENVALLEDLLSVF